MSKFSYIKKWEIAGMFWLIAIGSMLHFTFQWSGYSSIVGVFSAVNESVWEHLKLGYSALAMFMLIEYWFVKGKTTSFFIAKAVGIIAMFLFIVVVFYGYHAITGEHNLLVDIGSFMVGAILCQLISMRILEIQVKRSTNTIGLIIFLIIGAMFVMFTFYPPHLPLFMSSDGTYGINK